jgi:hypothetical protein
VTLARKESFLSRGCLIGYLNLRREFNHDAVIFMKSGHPILESENTESSRRQFLQKSAQTATALWGGAVLAGCGGGGSGGAPGLDIGNPPSAVNNSGGENPPAVPANILANENSTPPSVNTLTSENSSASSADSASNANSSPAATSPIVQFFSPSAEAPGGVIFIIDSKFDSTASVSFGGAVATQISVDSATQISVTVPVSAITGPITVRTAGGMVQSSAQFAVLSAPAPATGYRLG